MMRTLGKSRALRWLTAWVVWAALGGVAWAGYDARREELLRDVSAAHGLTGVLETKLLDEAIVKWSDARNEALSRLVRIVEDNGDGNTQQEREWQREVNAMRDQLARSIGDALRNYPEPSVEALKFRQTWLSQEDKFITGLGEVKVADARDAIVLNRKNVEELKRNLEEKWRALREQDQSIDDKEKEAAAELDKLVTDAVVRVASDRREFKDKLGRIVNTVTQIPRPEGLLPEWADAILQGFEKGTEVWLEMRNDFEARVKKYEGWVDGERGGILVLFKSMRDLTQDFVEKNKFALMKKRYEESWNKLDGWRSATSTAGQRRDADDFARDALAKLSAHLSADESTFNEFVRAHENRFFGPISPDVSEELIETKIWEDRVRSIRGRDLETRLREWRSDTENLWYVDMGPLTSEMRDFLKGFFRERVRRIVDAEQKLASYNERIDGYFDRRSLRDALK